MQYLVAVAMEPDLPLLQDVLQAIDPAALLDLDPASHALRVSTWMTRQELGGALADAGLAVTDEALVQLPSECCGGCGG